MTFLRPSVAGIDARRRVEARIGQLLRQAPTVNAFQLPLPILYLCTRALPVAATSSAVRQHSVIPLMLYAASGAALT